MRILVPTGLCLLLLASSAGSQDAPGHRLSRTTDLSASPEGERLGVLLSGAPVRILQRQGGWARVAVEGWVPLEEAAPEPAAAPPAGRSSQPSPQPPAVPGRTEARLSGTVFLTDEGFSIVGSGVAVRLLREAEATRRAIGTIREECAERSEALVAEAARFQDQAELAMKSIEGTSQAFEAYDEARRQRSRRLMDLRAHDRECAERGEAELERRAAARALTNGEGRFLLGPVAPGRYLVHAELVSGVVRHSWLIEADLASGDQSLDLTGANRDRREEIPAYR